MEFHYHAFCTPNIILVDVSGFFFWLGEWGGGVRGAGREGGVRFLIENPRKGGGVLQEGDGLRGREGVCVELGHCGRGGKYFFSGRNVHQVIWYEKWFEKREKRIRKTIRNVTE